MPDGALEDEINRASRETYSSHLNDQRNETFPTSLSSTMIEGLKSSRVFCRLTAFGAVTEIKMDPDIGSGKAKGENNPILPTGRG